MSLIRIDRHPSRRHLNLFGLCWLVFFALLGWTLWRRGNSTAAEAVWAAAALVPAVGVLVPEAMRWVYLGMMYATWPIGFVVSHVLLAIVYYVVLTPIGLTLRMLGHDPMSRKIDRQAATYWVGREQRESTDAYFRQF